MTRNHKSSPYQAKERSTGEHKASYNSMSFPDLAGMPTPSPTASEYPQHFSPEDPTAGWQTSAFSEEEEEDPIPVEYRQYWSYDDYAPNAYPGSSSVQTTGYQYSTYVTSEWLETLTVEDGWKIAYLCSLGFSFGLACEAYLHSQGKLQLASEILLAYTENLYADEPTNEEPSQKRYSNEHDNFEEQSASDLMKEIDAELLGWNNLIEQESKEQESEITDDPLARRFEEKFSSGCSWGRRSHVIFGLPARGKTVDENATEQPFTTPEQRADYIQKWLDTDFFMLSHKTDG